MAVLENPWHDDYDNVIAFHAIGRVLKPLGFHDETWRNNTCPSWAWYVEDRDEGIDVWIDYQDKSKSESGYVGKRCILVDADYCHDGICNQQIGFLPSQINDIWSTCKALQGAIKEGLSVSRS